MTERRVEDVSYLKFRVEELKEKQKEIEGQLRKNVQEQRQLRKELNWSYKVQLWTYGDMREWRFKDLAGAEDWVNKQNNMRICAGGEVFRVRITFKGKVVYSQLVGVRE